MGVLLALVEAVLRLLLSNRRVLGGPLVTGLVHTGATDVGCHFECWIWGSLGVFGVDVARV